MTVVSEMENTQLMIKVSGRFGFSVHNDFRTSCQDVDLTGKTVTVDLSAAEHLDSAALGMTLVLRERLGNNKQSICIMNSNSQVREVRSVSRFDQLFEVA